MIGELKTFYFGLDVGRWGGVTFCFWNAKGYVHYLNLIDFSLNVIPFCLPGSFHVPSSHKPI